MAVKTFTSEILTSADTNTYLANSGLVYVTSQTVGTAVASVTVSSCFSATYDNYLVTLSGGTMTVGTGISLTLSGVTTGYYGVFMYGVYTGGALINAPDNNNSVFSYVGGGGTDNATLNATLFGPFLAKSTRLTAGPVHWVSNFGTYNGVSTSTLSSSGVTVAPFSGTMTGGTITVYGYRKA
jgi:hypothetical protein